MLLHQALTNDILELYYEVYKELGFGFLEKVYQNALFLELQSRGYKVVAQQRCVVYYKKTVVGEFFSDIVVNDVVILELKAVESIHPEHVRQLMNYLRATPIEVGLLLNFGKEPEFVRKVYFNGQKKLPPQVRRKG